MIVCVVIVQTVGQEPAFRPVAGAPFALARFDAELAFLIEDALMFTPEILREFRFNGSNAQTILPLLALCRRCRRAAVDAQPSHIA
tara:strand:- start:1070 stop:1327 length:258 start_codon:yes stop_codon:yes gene_type:complete